MFFSNGIEAPFMLFYFNLSSFSFLKKTFLSLSVCSLQG